MGEDWIVGFSGYVVEMILEYISGASSVHVLAKGKYLSSVIAFAAC